MGDSWFPVRTVRGRTTALAAVLLTLALAAGATLLVVSLERSLTSSGDDLSKSRSENISAMAASGVLPRTLSDIGDDSVAQVVAATGKVVASSPNITGEPAFSTFRPTGTQPVVRTMDGVPDDDGTETYRVWVSSQQTGNGPVTVYVGSSLELVTETVSRLTTSLLFGIPTLVVLLALATWMMVGRTLRPVEAIRAEVASISHQDLERRVPVPPYDDEVGRLATTMNEMLRRLEKASRRQREFVANASHELQSPLAAFRTQLDVFIAHPEGADWPGVARDLHVDSDRMERLVHDLLFLARDDDRATTVPADLIDLDDVVLEEAARLRPACRAQLDTSGVTAAPVRGSRDELARLVRNLVENAAHHATARIRVELSANDAVRLSVSDDGAGVDPRHRERIFERFFRTDESRSRGTGSTGLGLSIARSIAERHGGSIAVDGGETGARFIVLLPKGD